MERTPLPAATRWGLALSVPLLGYLLAATALAVIVLTQGLPRGVEAQSTASREAWLFDGVAGAGLVVVAVLFTAVGILLSSGSGRGAFSPRRRRAVTAFIVLEVVLALFVFGVAGAMGWHDLGY